MKIFLVSPPGKWKYSPLVTHCLESFWYCRNDKTLGKKLHEHNVEWFLDSGAFTAVRNKIKDEKQYVLDYINYIADNREYISVFSNFDVIYDPEKTMYYQHFIEDKLGEAPLPVFHLGEDFSYLDYYLKKGYDYIGLGGAVPFAQDNKTRARFLNRVFRTVGTGFKIHGFGTTTSSLLRNYPFYSVDSSSWLFATRVFAICVFNPDIGSFVRLKCRTQKIVQYRHLFSMLGFDFRDFMKEEIPKDLLLSISLVSWSKFNAYINDLHRRKFGLTW